MTYVLQFDLKLAEKLRLGLESQGFTLTVPPHTLFQGKKKGLSCTLYTSGKLVVQGKEMKEFIEFYLEPEILGSFGFGYEAPDQDFSPHIGVDESGKGDFFGPLCVAGVFADREGIAELEKMGVKDSKRLKDGQILILAEKIRKKYPFHLVRIGPKRYNELYEKFGNLNLLLGWGHAAVIENMLEKTGCSRVVIDQFAAEHVVETALRRKGKNVHLIQRTQGERDLVVAAASILARASFVEGLSLLEKEMNQKLPKGAGSLTIESGKKLVARYGAQILQQVGKLHFKTTQTIVEPETYG
jgi:ribonuclease HIII